MLFENQIILRGYYKIKSYNRALRPFNLNKIQKVKAPLLLFNTTSLYLCPIIGLFTYLTREVMNPIIDWGIILK